MSIYIIGVGMGGKNELTLEAEEKINEADIVIGAKRITEPFANDKKVFYEYDADKITKILTNESYNNAAILFSGDVSFFSGAKKLQKTLENVTILPGISSMSYFCSKIGISYDDMNVVSMHGRDCNIVSEVRGHKKTFMLFGENPCKKLCEYGLGDVTVYIGENLSYENERILTGSAEEFKDTKTEPLSVAVIINENYDSRTRIGIHDSEFITGNVPMTKREVRAVNMSLLEIRDDDICIDIGAGTGSVTVEMALAAVKGKVYAVEKNIEAVTLIKKNLVKFHTDNVEVICGEATEVIPDLPKADKLFIGGSSGNLEKIIKMCDCRKVVINAITIETLLAAVSALKEFGYDFTVTQVSVARGKKVGSYNMMTAQNPIFILCGDKE